jgi:hypothetical protein
LLLPLYTLLSLQVVEEVASQLILITAGYEITNASHILEVQVMNLVHDSQLTAGFRSSIGVRTHT